jgi:hypothetical protein
MDYANLLREAIQSGSDETLADKLREHRRIAKTLPRRKLKGDGYSIAATPENAADLVAESEFNRNPKRKAEEFMFTSKALPFLTISALVFVGCARQPENTTKTTAALQAL